jgi:hypothetical protein
VEDLIRDLMLRIERSDSGLVVIVSSGHDKRIVMTQDGTMEDIQEYCNMLGMVDPKFAIYPYYNK